LIYLFQFNKDIVESYTMETKWKKYKIS
jgi:hypothetical protein